MSSSDEEIDTKTAPEHVIKPAKGGALLDTSTWPLLLKVRPFKQISKGADMKIFKYQFYPFFVLKTLSINSLILTHISIEL